MITPRSFALVLLAFVSSSLLPGAPDAAAQEGPVGGCAPAQRELILHLTMEGDEVPFGAAPPIQARLVNWEDDPITVVRPCDGSAYGLRYPHYRWELERADGAEIYRQMVGLCGTVNPYRASDFVDLGYSDGIDLNASGWLSHPAVFHMPLAPARYRARLTYVMQRGERKPHTLDDDLLPRWNAARECTVQSPWIEFEVLPPAEGTLGERWDLLASVRPGQPTEGVLERLGDPSRELEDEDGRRVLVYDLNPMTHLPPEHRLRRIVTLDEREARVADATFAP